MLENRLGVSPPQTGKTQDSKVANNKDLLGIKEDKSQYKNDFETALNKKLQKQKHDLEKKNETAKKEELRAERKEKKSSGGIKKKMTDVDEKMVSNVMASKESEVEAPVTEAKEPAKIEVKALEKQEPTKTDLSAALNSVVKSTESNLSQQKIEAAISPQSQVQSEAAQMASLESELSEASGFKSEMQALGANKELSAKLQQLGEKQDSKSAMDMAQVFEKNVLEQLQKESGLNAQTSSDSDKNSDSGLDKKGESDLSGLTGNELHQASGQTHGEFKSHLNTHSTSAATATDTTLAKLEENREANINHIMKQAQYLVKEGGGEVRVKMSPEGLGEVNLKVQLIEGKLNIEMQTADKNVKKLIEESLSELKSGLAAQRLSLEHVKIDTVNATNTDNNTQLHSNLNHGGTEGQGREFFKEFQQGSMNRDSRERSTSSGLDVQPRVVSSSPKASAAQALRTYGGAKGATINRVA